jgi:hypothetical protein
MNNRGSKSVTTFNRGVEKKVTVKEQRVDGSCYMVFCHVIKVCSNRIEK